MTVRKLILDEETTAVLREILIAANLRLGDHAFIPLEQKLLKGLEPEPTNPKD